MQYTIEELRHKLFSKIYDVYEVFKNHFGEDLVDLQGLPSNDEMQGIVYSYTDIGAIDESSSFEVSDASVIIIQSRIAERRANIIIWWPRVTVTNEHNKSVVIQDLYGKVGINMEGKIPYENWGFDLTRSTYNSAQFQSGYTHSHVPGFSIYSESSSITNWQHPCLGTGPIKNTINELKNSNDELTWMLFCEELARYVTVESLTGGPYRKLEEIGSAEKLKDYTDFTETYSTLREFYRHDNTPSDFYAWLKEFAVFYLQHGHLCFNYQNGSFKQGLSYFDYIIDISNAFIEWFNMTGNRAQIDSLFNSDTLIRSFAADGKFYKARRTSSLDASRFEGAQVLRFKGRNITLHIEVEQETELETTILLNHKIAMYILQNVLKIINYRYKNEHTNTTGGEAIAPTYRTVIYL